jgi:hypothetical protein
VARPLAVSACDGDWVAGLCLAVHRGIHVPCRARGVVLQQQTHLAAAVLSCPALPCPAHCRYDGNLNPSFNAGPFQLPVEVIRAYLKEPVTPRCVCVCARCVRAHVRAHVCARVCALVCVCVCVCARRVGAITSGPSARLLRSTHGMCHTTHTLRPAHTHAYTRAHTHTWLDDTPTLAPGLCT